MKEKIEKLLEEVLVEQAEEQPGTTSHAFLTGKARAFELMLELLQG